MAFDGAAPAYEPGDSLDLYSENDPAYVDALLKAAGLGPDQTLIGDLLTSRDVTTLSLKTLDNFVAATGHESVKALIADGQAREWIAGRQLIDLVEAFPRTSLRTNCGPLRARWRRAPTRSRPRAARSAGRRIF